MKVDFSYLSRQFDRPDEIFEDLKEFIKTGDFTLGKKLDEFEAKFADFIGVKHAIGVNSGTDALILSLKAQGIGSGDEVITSAETFIATAGAIAAAGARPVFVDVNDEYEIDASLIKKAITKKTKAIMPVWFTGNAPDMVAILKIAEKHGLPVVEDSCCGIDAAINGKKAGSFGLTGAFSFHPLKNLNVWSDGGMITTNSDEMNKKLRLLRNHGLATREEIEMFGVNSRLDTFQAVVALRLLPLVKNITDTRIANAKKLDEGFRDLAGFIEIPKRCVSVRQVFHLYMVRAKNRDKLLQYCVDRRIEAKVHYPIPLPYQKCAQHLGYNKGDFPKTERDCSSIITFPAHQHLTNEEIQYVINTVKEFYSQ